MLRFIYSALVTITLIMAFGSSSFAQAPQRQKIGSLTCRIAPSIGLLIGSQQRMACQFVPDVNGGAITTDQAGRRIG